ncbi:MAG TPA: SpoIIE family protein phosphatase, partial [Pyrinomonadaceae bacterium]|nr:SpoIIE family protein phosphatase [Pyrinomonadaceae bacterium]
MPNPKSIRRLKRQVKRHLSPRRIYYFTEGVVLLTVFVLIFSGSRLRFIDGFGRRSDLIVALLLVAAAIPLHFYAKRRLLPRIERRYNPAPYDEHKIFFDLGQGAREVSSIDQLYENLADKIREAFEASNAAIFVHDEMTGDFNLRVLSAPGETKTKANAKKRLSLGSRAFVVRRLVNLSTPLTLEPHDVETWEQAVNSTLPSLRETRANEHDVLKQVKSRLLVQIRQKDELVGILSLGPRRGEFHYSPSDRELLMSIAAQLGLVIDNARLTERMVAQERLRRELVLAAEVQQRLLPSHPPECKAMEVAGFCEPARGIGGDYYDFINFDNCQMGLAIADVAGKGMPAALLMSTVQATLRSLTARNGAPVPVTPELSQIVGKLNRLLFDSTNGEHYVTFFYATFDQA